MESASSVVESGVHLPAYELISGDLLRQFENASSVVAASTDDLGEFYAMVMAVSVPAAMVADSSSTGHMCCTGQMCCTTRASKPLLCTPSPSTIANYEVLSLQM